MYISKPETGWLAGLYLWALMMHCVACVACGWFVFACYVGRAGGCRGLLDLLGSSVGKDFTKMKRWLLSQDQSRQGTWGCVGVGAFGGCRDRCTKTRFGIPEIGTMLGRCEIRDWIFSHITTGWLLGYMQWYFCCIHIGQTEIVQISWVYEARKVY